MEFKVRLDAASPALDTVHDACLAADPAAVVDIAPDGAAMRIATVLDLPALATALVLGGWALAPGQLQQLPSVCCGGCSG